MANKTIGDLANTLANILSTTLFECEEGGQSYKIQWSNMLANNGDPIATQGLFRGFIKYGGIRVATTDNLIIDKMVVDLNGTMYTIAETNLEFNGQSAGWYVIGINEGTQVISRIPIATFSSGASGNQLDMYSTFDPDRQYCYNSSERGIAGVYFNGTTFEIIIQWDNRPKDYVICESDTAQQIETAAEETVDYEDIVVDVNSNVTTGANWKFEPTKGGVFSITAMFRFATVNSWSQGDALYLILRNDTAVINYFERKEVQTTFNGHDLSLAGTLASVPLTNDVDLKIRVFQNTGVSINSGTSPAFNYTMIKEL